MLGSRNGFASPLPWYRGSVDLFVAQPAKRFRSVELSRSLKQNLTKHSQQHRESQVKD